MRRAQRGQAVTEFAIVVPILLTLVFGIVAFGITLNNYQMLTNAANISAQTLTISRGQTSDPCATAVTAFENAAPNLTANQLKFSFVIDGVSESNVTSCTGAVSDLVAGQQAKETVTYPCNLYIAGFNPAPSCTLTAVVAEAIQ